MHDHRLVPVRHGGWRELATGGLMAHPTMPPISVPRVWQAWAEHWAASDRALHPGPMWIDPPHPMGDGDVDESRVVAAALMPHGFVVVHAGVAWPDAVWRTVCQRHVVLIAAGASPTQVARLVRDLVSVSSRPHRVLRARTVSSGVQEGGRSSTQPLLVSDTEARARIAWARAVRYGTNDVGVRASLLCEALARHQTVEAWRKVCRVVATSSRAASLDVWVRLTGWDAQARLAALDLERAAALVSAGELVCELMEMEAPSSLQDARRHLTACTAQSGGDDVPVWVPQGRSRLATVWRGVADGDRAACVEARRRGLTGPFLREGQMVQWSEIAGLWRAVQEASTDLAAITAACEWVRGRVRAVSVVVLASATGRAIGSAGDPSMARAHGASEADVRYGGDRIAVMRASGVEPSAWAEQVLALAASACAAAVRARLDGLADGETAEGPVAELRGQSPAMRAVRETILRVAATGFPVLIEGESGVGKELVARAIHRASPRRDRRLASVNCAAITDELFEAEVFGHARGAFTGAVGPRVGLFEEAHGGTLFLDEVAELSARGQAKVLRALQEGEVRRLGENQGRTVDVRIVAATNRPLQAAAAAGQFREDLVFRLAVVRLTVPPLRERVEDIPALAAAAWARAVTHRPTRAVLTADALAALCRYRWPGNVRELQNVMAALVLAAPARGMVTADHVSQVIAADASTEAVTLAAARRSAERRVVRRALARHAGCRTTAARELGVTRQGLAKLLARLGPDV